MTPPVRALTIVLAALLLLGGATTPASAQKPKIRVWLLRTYVPDANRALEDSIKRWAVSKNLDPVIEYFTFDDIETKYVAAIETNALPDVGQLQTIGPARYRGMGKLTDLTDLANELVKANGPMLESALPVVRAPDGRFHAVPFNYITDVQFIRTDIFRRAGVRIPTTWEEVREANRVIKAKGVMEYPLGQSWNRSADGYGVFQALLYSYGGGWADEQGNYKSIVNDTWRTVVRWASEIYLTDKTVPPDAMSWTGFGNNEAFLTGKIAFTFNGPSIYYVLEKENRPILKDTVMAVKPAGPAGRDHDVFLLSWTLFNTSKQPELAPDLIRFVLSNDQAKKYMHASSGQMVPAFERLRADPYWQKNESYRAVLEAPKYARTPGWPGPLTAAAAEVVATNVLTDQYVGYAPRFVGLANYAALARDPIFHKVVWNSAVFTLASVAVKVVLGMLMALALQRALVARSFLRAVLLVPWVIPTVITALTWHWMFNALWGLINVTLQGVGLQREPIAWLGQPATAMAAVITANVWRGFPFFGVSLLAGMQTIPRDLYEAAAVDGASPAQRFWHITLPGLRLVLLVTTLISLIFTLNDFNIVYVLTRGGPGTATHV